MLNSSPVAPGTGGEEFERAARKKSRGLLGEIWDFLRHSRKWWLLPIIIVLVLIAGLVILSSTALAPFIYTLF